MITLYLIINLLVVIWVLLDYILNDGKIFMVHTDEEVAHAAVLMIIPPINVILLGIIAYKHVKNK